MSDDAGHVRAVDEAGEHLSAGVRLVAADGRDLPLKGVRLRPRRSVVSRA